LTILSGDAGFGCCCAQASAAGSASALSKAANLIGCDLAMEH
jgi:hypothetical protein